MSQPNAFLVNARLARHWTQQQLAQRLNVSANAVRSWERGRRIPSLAFREELCTLFNMSSAALGFEAIKNTSSEDAEPALAVVHWARTNRQRMLEQVKRVWIDGVLHQSLHHKALIMLDLQDQPDALANPWQLVVQETNLPPRALPSGTHLVHIYDASDGHVLLLGEPGAGKTMLLLELARVLLKRAEQDEDHPMPVVFHLAAWAATSSRLAVWFVEELATKYQVPRHVAQYWVDNEAFLFLLDGLDEVSPARRAACIRAIEDQRAQHPDVPVVVCCRYREYVAMPQLTRGRAVTIQQLTEEQVDRYLGGTDDISSSLRRMLEQERELLDLVKTPLMLSVVTLASHDTSAALLFENAPDVRKQTLLERSIQRMLSRGSVEKRYRQEDVVHWLSWLAMQMQRRDQREWSIERMQPDLLPSESRQHYSDVLTSLLCGIESFVLAALLGWLRGGNATPLFGGGSGGSVETILGWIWPGLGVGGLDGGSLVSFVLTMVAALFGMMITPRCSRQPFSLRLIHVGLIRGVRSGVLCAGCVWLFCFLVFGLRGGLSSGLLSGSHVGILTGLLIGPLSGLTVLREKQTLSSKQRPVWQGVRHLGCNGILPAVSALAGFLIVNAFVRLQDGLLSGCVVAFFFFAAYGPGGVSERLRVSAAIQPAEVMLWSWATVRATLPRSIACGCLIGLSMYLSVALGSGIEQGFTSGVMDGLIFAPIIGVSVGAAGLLSGVLQSGWENEGIRRSWRNAVLAARCFGPLGGVVSGVICAIFFGAIAQVSTWPTLAGACAIAFGTLFGFYLLLFRGGVACLEHYLLRYFLWRMGAIPADYVHFLNYAVKRVLLLQSEGGYIFLHRLFFDYFASLGEYQESDKLL